MGFFSSNKGGSTQVIDRQEAAPNKTRWFSPKPKQTSTQQSTPVRPPPPPTPSLYPAPPTLSSRVASTPIHQSYQSPPSAAPVPNFAPSRSKQSLPPTLTNYAPTPAPRRAPSLFSDRGSHYGTNAVASGSGSKGFGGDDQSSTLGPRRGKAREDVTTETLATRLNELALANADGLLGDDEYRILRQTMFEQVASSSSAPSEPTYGRIPNGHEDRSGERENLRTPTPGNYDASSSSRPASVHSTSSSRSKLSALGSMFRRKPSHSGNHDTSSNQHRSSSSRRESSSGSLFSSTSSTANGRSSLLQVPGERSRNNSADFRFSSSNSQLGNSSIRSGRTGRSALTEHTFNDPSRPASLFSTTSTRASASAPPSAFHLRTLHSSNGSMSSSAGHDGEAALPGAEATPAEVRLEIASVEAEGRRLVAAFDGLEEAAFREAEGGIGPGGDGGHHGGVIDVSTEGANDWTVLPSPDRPKPLKPALKQPSSSISSPASSQGHRTSYLSQPSLPSPPSTLSHKLSRSINPSSTTTSSLHSRSTSSATNRGRVSVDRSFTSSLSRTGEAGEDDDPEAAALEATVLDIRRRKKDTEERYERRLTFLKGKLRAAELKERAMR